MPYTQVANLDFEDIKAQLKEYLRAQSDFTDYDFEGSALSTLIDSPITPITRRLTPIW